MFCWDGSRRKKILFKIKNMCAIFLIPPSTFKMMLTLFLFVQVAPTALPVLPPCSAKQTSLIPPSSSSFYTQHITYIKHPSPMSFQTNPFNPRQNPFLQHIPYPLAQHQEKKATQLTYFFITTSQVYSPKWIYHHLQ